MGAKPSFVASVRLQDRGGVEEGLPGGGAWSRLRGPSSNPEADADPGAPGCFAGPRLARVEWGH